MSEIKEPSLHHRIIAIIGGTGSFIITVWVFFTIFSAIAEPNVSVVMSVISGVMVGWIVLSLSGVLKQFSFKSPFFEMTANIERKIDEVKKSNEKIESDVKSVNNRIDSVISNQMNVTMNPSFQLINNLKEINQTEDEIQRAVSAGDIDNKIHTGKLEPEKNISISPELQNKLDKLILKQNELQNTLNEIDNFPIDVMKSIRNANYYYSTNDFEKSLKILKRILKDEPNNVKAIRTSALCYSSMGDYDKAIEFVKKALDINPKDKIALGSLSHYLIRANKIEDAKKIIVKLTTAYPKHGLGWFNKACVESLENKPKESIQSLKKAIEFDPKNKKLAEEDDDLKNLKRVKEFKELVEN